MKFVNLKHTLFVNLSLRKLLLFVNTELKCCKDFLSLIISYHRGRFVKFGTYGETNCMKKEKEMQFLKVQFQV